MLDVFECKLHGETDLARCKECVDFRLAGGEMLLLRNNLSPGDVLVMSAAIESLHRAHPGKFTTAIKTSCDAVFEHNPRIEKAQEGMREVQMHYPLIHESNQRLVHFMQGYCDYFTQVLGVSVPLLVNRPHLYLSKEEKTWINQVQELTGQPTPFWIINAGRKSCFTAKHWGHQNYQKLVNILKGKVTFVQIGQKGHYHRPLEGVIDLVGKTDARQLIRLAYHSQGGVGPSTFLQHLCAAWEKPYVCLLGGREPLSWVQYPFQTTLHTFGMMECCKKEACWKSRTVPLGDNDEKDQSLCKAPTEGDPDPVPGCLAKISPEEVALAITKYL